jgi:hypothetical protein
MGRGGPGGLWYRASGPLPIDAYGANLNRYGLLHRIPRPETPPARTGNAPTADGYFGPDINRADHHGDRSVAA